MNVRPVQKSDRQAVVKLLCDTFPVRVAPERWNVLFDYPWMQDPPNHGFLIEDDGEVVGFMGAIFSDRIIQGRTTRICTITSWCVREDRRGRTGTQLAVAYHRWLEENAMPTLVFSAGPHILPFLRRLGFVSFRAFRGVRYAVPPVLDLVTGRAPRWVDVDAVEPEHVGQDAWRIMRDHVPTLLTVGALRAGGRTCVVITKLRNVSVARPGWAKRLANEGYGKAGPVRRWVNRARDLVSGTIHATEVVYVSDPEFFQRHLRGVAFRIGLRDRTVALTGDQRLLGLDPPADEARVDDYLYCFPVPGSGPSDYDALYSEIALLEFTHRS